MNCIKKSVVIIFTTVMSLCFALNCFAIKIDGSIDAFEEWADCPMIEMAQNKDTGCNEEFIIFRHKFIPEKKILYFAFQCVEYKNIVDINNCAFKIKINNFSPIVISYNDAQYDEEALKVNGVWSKEIDGESLEAKITFLKNAGDKLDFSFTVTDSHGIESKTYSITIDGYVKQAETTKSDSDKNKTTTSKAETKTKTTKVKTTKEKITSKPYSTVKEKDRSSSGYVTAQTGVTNAESVTETSDETEVTTQSVVQSNGKIVLKTVSVCILAVSAVAFATVLFNRKRQS